MMTTVVAAVVAAAEPEAQMRDTRRTHTPVTRASIAVTSQPQEEP
jgi:hypothetical protein